MPKTKLVQEENKSKKDEEKEDKKKDTKEGEIEEDSEPERELSEYELKRLENLGRKRSRAPSALRAPTRTRRTRSCRPCWTKIPPSR